MSPSKDPWYESIGGRPQPLNTKAQVLTFLPGAFTFLFIIGVALKVNTDRYEWVAWLGAAGAMISLVLKWTIVFKRMKQPEAPQSPKE